MVVDDSVVIRGLISRWIGAEPDMEVSASLRTGLDAVNQLERVNPDVAVLDIEMPELDGISALPQLLAKKRDLVIIMASTLTRRNAEISFKALSLGASDYIPKPESTREATAAETFHHDLIQKIRHLGAKIRRTSHAPAHASPPSAPAHAQTAPPAPPIMMGTAWYPEQWPESRWDEDLTLMQQAGIRMVRVGEFAWSRMEPSEGHYDLDWLDHAITAAAKHGIYTVVGTPTAAPPAWLTQKYPETLRIDEMLLRAEFRTAMHQMHTLRIFREHQRFLQQAQRIGRLDCLVNETAEAFARLRRAGCA